MFFGFLSTLSLRRATIGMPLFSALYTISIHALLAESDYVRPGLIAVLTYFYPRSPCGERHQATYCCADSCNDFYPRSPCGERRNRRCGCKHVVGISIHALLAESDVFSFCFFIFDFLFLSTLSLRRATFEKFEGVIATKISIHALLAESDCARL